jgi:hypothetical protein
MAGRSRPPARIIRFDPGGEQCRRQPHDDGRPQSHKGPPSRPTGCIVRAISYSSTNHDWPFAAPFCASRRPLRGPRRARPPTPLRLSVGDALTAMPPLGLPRWVRPGSPPPQTSGCAARGATNQWARKAPLMRSPVTMVRACRPSRRAVSWRRTNPGVCSRQSAAVNGVEIAATIIPRSAVRSNIVSSTSRDRALWPAPTPPTAHDRNLATLPLIGAQSKRLQRRAGRRGDDRWWKRHDGSA